MLISSKSTEEISNRLSSCGKVYCSGLFLSARWFVVSQLQTRGNVLVVLPDKESAEYCASDLYNMVEGDSVFFMPDSGRNLERSNYKSSLAVQRTSAIGKILQTRGSNGGLYVVSYPEALEEGIPEVEKIKNSVLTLRCSDEISHEQITEILFSQGFEKVDFVSEPGQFAIRGSIVDIFSYS